MLFQFETVEVSFDENLLQYESNRMLSVDSMNRLKLLCLLLNRLNYRSDGSAVFRQVFCPRISPTQTGKSEATRPSRVCEPVQIDGEPVVLYGGLASCAVSRLYAELASYCQSASCTACLGARKNQKSGRCCIRTFH